MANTNEASGALMVLIFVCGPLILLLILLLRALVRASRRTARFPAFSVRISRVGRAEAYVYYKTESGEKEFAAHIGRGKSFFSACIFVNVTEGMSEEDIPVAVPRLAQAFESLRYNYVIYHVVKRRNVPGAGHEAVKTQPNKAGFGIPVKQEQVVHPITNDWRSSSRERAEITGIQNMRSKAKNLLEDVEVLARSG
jgi:hypothetical protein